MYKEYMLEEKLINIVNEEQKECKLKPFVVKLRDINFITSKEPISLAEARAILENRETMTLNLNLLADKKEELK